MARNLNEQLHEAHTRLQSGDLHGAGFLIDAVLQRAPANPQAQHLLGLLRIMQGQPALAAPHLERALRADRLNGTLLDHAGLAYLMLGRFQDAEQVLRRAAALPGAPPVVTMRLGMALLNQGKVAESIPCFRNAAARAPDDPDCQVNLGQALHRNGDIEGARAALQTALRLAPANADALFNLGAISLDAQAFEDARLWFERALAVNPQHIESWINRGVVLEHLNRLDTALECYQKALAIDPHQLNAANNLAHVLLRLGRAEDARERYLAALATHAGSVLLHEGAAAACVALGRSGEALFHLRAVLSAEPQNQQALVAIARALLETGDLDQAERHARAAWAARGDDACSVLALVLQMRGATEEAVSVLEAGHAAHAAPALLGTLVFQYRQQCDWDKWQSAWAQLAPQIATNAALGSPFWLLCEPCTAEQLLEYTRAWAAARFAAVRPPPAPRSTTNRSGRIRVGYLSSDFRDHAAAYLIAEVLELHNREKFEIFLYSYGPDDASVMRKRLSAACEHFVDIAWEPDDVAATRIRNDALDILVDLKGYTVGDRLPIMARRPCDIQVTWLGYPGTTGASFMDYLIADPYIVPPGQEHTCSEQVVRMPHCYQPNDRKRHIAASRARGDYRLPEKGFVFCCFNQTFKITPDIYAIWMKLLKQVPESVLWLVDDNPTAKQNLRRAAQSHGIAPNRVLFAPRLPYAEHLARYRVADLALDTFPYTSHTTLSDALWCGCPAAGLAGNTFASRVSGSLLHAANLPDLVTTTLEQYEALAMRFATDAIWRDNVRTRILQAREHAPLFDAARFARDLEGRYRIMLDRRQADNRGRE